MRGTYSDDFTIVYGIVLMVMILLMVLNTYKIKTTNSDLTNYILSKIGQKYIYLVYIFRIGLLVIFMFIITFAIGTNLYQLIKWLIYKPHNRI